MPINKPEVVKYIVPKHEAWDVRTLVSPKLPSEQLMVLASDYEALQAAYEEELSRVRQDRDTYFGEMMRAIEQVDVMKDECEELRTALSESQANDRQAMYYLNQIRRIVGGHDFPDMVERCRKLVK